MRRLPQHWCNMITKMMKDICLTSSKHDPCLFSWIIDDGTPLETSRNTIHIGLYVDEFIFFLDSDVEESHFKKILNGKVTTDFMGEANLLLG